MFETTSSTKKKTRAFYDYELKRMSEQGFKPPGWMNYKESPYKKYQETMESKEYGKNIRSSKSKADS